VWEERERMRRVVAEPDAGDHRQWCRKRERPVYRDLLTFAVRRQSGQSIGTMSRTVGWVSSRDFQPDRINRSISS
jgi:hypothetical protein